MSEFVLEGPEEGAPEAAEELSRLMVQATIPWLPDVVPPAAEPLISRVWSKKAKALRDASGRLMVWS